jgi:hypothetical protein
MSSRKQELAQIITALALQNAATIVFCILDAIISVHTAQLVHACPLRTSLIWDV